MAKRQVFFSFHYDKDNWRAAQVRNMGKIDSSSTLCDNDWEEVKKKTNREIENWIDNQLKMRSCLVVLIGSQTYGRKWIEYEIKKAYELQKGIVGIYIHNLEDRFGYQSSKGNNPFYNIMTKDRKRLSQVVDTFDSIYTSSSYVYRDIQNNMEQLIDDAIARKGTY